MQDLEKEIAEKYNLGIRGISPYKDAFIINTSEGRKVIRKSSLSGERILFIHAAKEHLYRNKFINLDRTVCTAQGIPYIEIEGSNYTMTDLIEGNECNFDNKNDVIHVSRLLASLHKASKGFIPPENSVIRSDLGKLPVFFGKRLDEIKKLKKVARKGKSRFDYLFLECYDYFYQLGEDALNQMNASKYQELVENTKNEGVFCHHDFTHHNIIHPENKYYIINFDFCCFELKVYDIANLIRRKMRKCNWDTNEARVILNEYRTVEELCHDEFLVMKIILQFPQKFWRVINKYYNSKRSWSEKSFIIRLQEVIDEIEYHKSFMEKFDLLE
jgi:CotS family spore coat protein